jgi:hypothetical protein
MHWAWKEGSEGRNYRETRDKAADIGTLAHAMVEADIRKHDFPEPKKGDSDEMWEKAMNCYSAWEQWKKEVQFEPVATEQPLVSRRLKFGGTLDVATVRAAVAILDLKTSKDVYPDHLIQLAAYKLLWNENNPKTLVKDCYLLRLGKDGSFAYYFYPDLSLEGPKDAFLRLLELHQLKGVF